MAGPSPRFANATGAGVVAKATAPKNPQIAVAAKHNGPSAIASASAIRRLFIRDCGFQVPWPIATRRFGYQGSFARHCNADLQFAGPLTAGR